MKSTFRLKKKRNEYDEYVVEELVNGKFREEGSYYTDDWDDAVGTLKDLAKRAGLIVKSQGNGFIADSIKDSTKLIWIANDEYSEEIQKLEKLGAKKGKLGGNITYTADISVFSKAFDMSEQELINATHQRMSSLQIVDSKCKDIDSRILEQLKKIAEKGDKIASDYNKFTELYYGEGRNYMDWEKLKKENSTKYNLLQSQKVAWDKRVSELAKEWDNIIEILNKGKDIVNSTFKTLYSSSGSRLPETKYYEEIVKKLQNLNNSKGKSAYDSKCKDEFVSNYKCFSIYWHNTLGGRIEANVFTKEDGFLVNETKHDFDNLDEVKKYIDKHFKDSIKLYKIGNYKIHAKDELHALKLYKIIDSVADMGWSKSGQRIPAHNTYNNRISLDDLKKTMNLVMSQGNNPKVVDVLIGQLKELELDYDADINNSSLNSADTLNHYRMYKKFISNYTNSQISNAFKNAVNHFVNYIK